MKIPTEADWGNWRDDLDTEDAHKNFAGLSQEAAIERFAQPNILLWIENLRDMAPVPFRYYLLALCDYVQSDRAQENADPSDLAACFLDLVLLKLETESHVMRPILQDVMPTVEYVGARQKHFRAPESIYGSFGEKLRKIRRLAKQYGV